MHRRFIEPTGSSLFVPCMRSAFSASRNLEAIFFAIHPAYFSRSSCCSLARFPMVELWAKMHKTYHKLPVSASSHRSTAVAAGRWGKMLIQCPFTFNLYIYISLSDDSVFRSSFVSFKLCVWLPVKHFKPRTEQEPPTEATQPPHAQNSGQKRLKYQALHI